MVNNSPWPLLSSLTLFTIMLNTVSIIKLTTITYISKQIIILGIILLFINVANWLYEIIIESTYQGLHTKTVQKLIIEGYWLFILSEILIFATLFLSFFYLALVPSIEVGSIWPPLGVYTLNWKCIPVLNTVILYISGITITMACHKILSSSSSSYFITLKYLLLTLFLGCIFFYFQTVEYTTSLFNISDSVYGTLFYAITGLHAIHGATSN